MITFLLAMLPYTYNHYHSFSLKWVKVNGTIYKKHGIIILPEKVKEDLTFGKIHDITLKDSSVWFFLQVYNTVEFCEHYNAYIISETEQSCVLPLKESLSYLCFHANYIHSFTNCLAVVLRYLVK